MLTYFPILFAGYLSFLTLGPVAEPTVDAGFRSPLGIPLALTGTFGELRTNHFHSGIDIATQGRTGLNIYACEEGYVSRVRIGPRGFGKALYITHPNGLMTVYAHLSKFDESIQEWVLAKQFELEQWGFDLELEPGELKVTKGQVVALSGNSGSSGGPHLHFEIRDGDTPLNPLNFGFKVADTQSPLMTGLYLYDVWEDHPVSNATYYPLTVAEKKTDDHKRKVTRYTTGKSMLHGKGDFAGIGIRVYDKLDARHSKNGVYRLQMKLDGKVVYHFKMDSFHFHESRYINAHIDFGESVRNKTRLHRCFRLPGNKLSIYDKLVDDGLAKLFIGSHREVEIRTWDRAGNQSILSFSLDKLAEASPPEVAFNQVMEWETENTCVAGDCKLTVGEGSLYQDLFLSYNKTVIKGGFSDKYAFESPETPIHSDITVSIRADRVPDDLKDKALIVFQDPKGNRASFGGEIVDGYLTCSSKKLGSYFIDIDTVAPKLVPLNIGENKFMGNEKTIRFKVTDNLSGFAEYRAEINGKWVPMSYDPRKSLLAFDFDSYSLEPGSHSFVLTVEDARKNVTSTAFKFRR